MQEEFIKKLNLHYLLSIYKKSFLRKKEGKAAVIYVGIKKGTVPHNAVQLEPPKQINNLFKKGQCEIYITPF